MCFDNNNMIVDALEAFYDSIIFVSDYVLQVDTTIGKPYLAVWTL